MFSVRAFRFVLLVVFLAIATWGQVNPVPSDWVILGPEGGDVRSLAYDPHNPDRIYLGTSAGELYASWDNGATWQHFAHLGAGNDYVLDHIVVDPDDSNQIYVAAWSIENNGGDVFRSRDGGRTWIALPALHGKSVRSFALFAADSRIMVAGTLDGVFRSTDGGDSWNLISPANHAEIKNIESIAIDPRSPDVIYAGTWHLPWKSSDGGRTWHSIKNGIIDDSDVFSIIIDQHNPATVYLSACSGIYKSENAGESFHKVQGIPFSARRTRVLYQDPETPAIVYAGTTEGLWKTYDAGKSWRQTTAPNLIVNDVLVDPRRPSRVLLATDRSGVLASNDGAQSVAAANHGFAHRQVAAVLADSRDPATLYAGVVNDKEFGGVFVSFDAGAHWRQMNSGLAGHDIFSLAQSPDGELMAGTHRGVYLFDSHLARWRPVNLVLREEIVAVSRRQKTAKGKIVKQMTTRRQYVKSELDARIARLAVEGKRWFAATSAGMYASLDDGHSWHGGPVAGLRDFLFVDALADTVLAGTPAGVVLSRNGGADWTLISLPSFVTTVKGVALAPGTLWVATGEGAFFSTDSGSTWQHVVAGIPAQNLTSVRYDSVAQRLLGTTPSGKIFASRDAGQSWTLEAAPGWRVRALSLAGGRLLGITAFNGIVAPPQPDSSRAVASSGGSSQ